MFKRFGWLFWLLIWGAVPASYAQIAALTGYCNLGATPAKTSGLSSTNNLQGVIPKCTVTIYLTGTQTLATIYADKASTPLSNPFTATTSGQWTAFSAINVGYDVVLSGGIAPNAYPSPVTLTDVYPSFSFSGGGANPAPPQYAVQYAGPSAMAFNADSTFSFNTATHGLSAYLTNGGFNSDIAATGGGNNGVANLIAGPCAGAGCLFQRPQTSTDTEDIASALNSAGDYTHATDSKYGTDSHYFYNAGLGSTGNREVNPNTCFWNDSTAIPNAKNICNSKYTMYFSPGQYVTGSPAISKSSNEVFYSYGRSIAQMHSSTFYCYHVGDCANDYNYFYFRTNAAAGADESIEGHVLNMIEPSAPYGTVTTGGPDATTIKINTNTSLLADGLQTMDTSQLMASGLILSQTTGSGKLLNSMTTSDTHAVSTGIATLTSACGANQARNAPANATCSITVTSGSFSVDATQPVCVGDYQAYPEQAKVIAVGSGTITLGLTYAHSAGVPIYQGGGCGGRLVLGNGYSVAVGANKNPTSYLIEGARTATSFDYIVVNRSGQNGQPQIVVPAIQTDNLGSLTRASNVVTMQGPPPGAAYMNNFVAPDAASIVVSGATPSDLNGVVTGVKVNSATMSWNQTGADETGSGGTIAVTGLNNYFIYCGAETVRLIGTLANAQYPALDGTVQLEPNSCNWTAGDSVTQANGNSINIYVTRNGVNSLTAPTSFNNVGNNLSMTGPGNYAAIENRVVNGDALSTQLGYGGYGTGHTYLQSNAFYANMFNFSYPPMIGNSMFLIGCPPEGCIANTFPYGIFELSGYNPSTGAVQANKFSFNPANSTFSMTAGLSDLSYLSAGTALGVAGSKQLPGGSGQGGFFSANIVNNTITFGNGNFSDASGTLAAAQVYVPTIIAGVNSPGAFTTYNIGASGSTTYTYACVAITANGHSAAAYSTTTTGNATLSSMNSNEPKCFAPAGAQSLDIYRTTGGATQGKIANIPTYNGVSAALSFFDTGIAGDGTSPPTTNTTGKLTVLGTSATVNGKNICLADGTNCPAAAAIPKGRTTLVSGTATVGTAAASTSGTYTLTNCGASGTAIGTLSVGTVTAGTSFVINSLTATDVIATGDTSTVCWMIQ